MMFGGSEIHELFALERFLPFRLSKLADGLARKMATECCRPFGMSLPEWRVLALLGEHGPMPSWEIFPRASVDRTRLSRAVSCLVDLGYLKRRLVLSDHRRVILELTPSGQQVYAQAVPVALAVQERALSTLSDEERAMFWRAMLKVEANAGLAPPAAGDMERGESRDAEPAAPRRAAAHRS